MRRVIFSLLILLSSFSFSFSQSVNVDKEFQNFLIISQYSSTAVNRPYLQTTRRSLLGYRPWAHQPNSGSRSSILDTHSEFWNGGFITHIDLSPNDFNSNLEVYSQIYENIYGEYQIPVHSDQMKDFVRTFKTTKVNGEFRIIGDDYHNLGIYFSQENPLRYTSDNYSTEPESRRSVIIARPNENEITRYGGDGIPRETVSAKYEDGKLIEIDTKDETITFKYDNDRLFEVWTYTKHLSSKQLVISFSWEGNTLKGFHYTKGGEKFTFKTKVLSTNEEGLWTQLQLFEIVDGEEIPFILYERVFDNKRQVSQENVTSQTTNPSVTASAVRSEEDDKIDLNYYLLITQYSNFVSALWGDIFDLHYYCKEGIIAHCDLSLNDICEMLTIERIPFENRFGEYITNNSSTEVFKTVKTDEAISIPTSADNYGSFMSLDVRELIVKYNKMVIIQEKEKNKLSYYNDDGSLFKEIECKYDELGRIVFMHRNTGSPRYEKEGYYIQYAGNNISKIELQEYNEAGYEKYDLSTTTDISFQWNGRMLTGLNIIQTSHRQEEIEPIISMNMEIVESNSAGKWTKMNLYITKNGKDIPTYQYCRKF